MRVGRAALVVVAVVAGAVGLSGGSGTDPRTPRGLPGMPTPFLGTAVVGSGGRTAAVDAYGNVVDLRAQGPGSEASVAVPAERQVAGSVEPGMAIVARAPVGGADSLPFWRADSVRQRYLHRSNVLRTTARFGTRTYRLTQAAVEDRLGCRSDGTGPTGLRCALSRIEIGKAAHADRRWLARARPLAADAPAWVRRMYERSLLVLRALTDRRTGAVVAGARDGWAYVWPRDAAAVALAYRAAGYRVEARRVVRFLLRLDLEAAARFRGTGEPVPGRDAQGDAAGWVAAAARATGLPTSRLRFAWRDRADYHEGDRGDYLANAIASIATADGPRSDEMRPNTAHRRLRRFVTAPGLVRVAGEPGSGLDSAAAWAVRPFPVSALFSAVRRTLLRIVAERESRYGIVPSEGWAGGDDPWTAPTAWVAWALAALAQGNRDASGLRATSIRERRAALSLMADLRRAAAPLGLLPERVDAESGLPRSTTPLAWSHAFAILALRELWPRPAGSPLRAASR